MSEVIYQSRKVAKENGGKKYCGKPCTTCGGTKRFVCNCTCVICERQFQQARRNKKKRENNGATSYHGTPCKNCGGTERYSGGGGCVACSKSRSKTPERKAQLKVYDQTPERKAQRRAFERSSKRKAYYHTPKSKAYKKAYIESPGGRASRLYSAAQKRAEKKKFLFTIRRDEIERLLLIAEHRWKEIGIEFDYTTGQGKRPLTPSLDQVRAGKGYTRDNIQIVPWAWNALKGNHFTDGQAIEFCKTIADATR